MNDYVCSMCKCTTVCQRLFSIFYKNMSAVFSAALKTPNPSSFPPNKQSSFFLNILFLSSWFNSLQKKYLIKIFILIFSFSQIIDQSLISSSHQFNTKTCSEHYHIWQREAANQHIEEAEIGFPGILFWKKYRIHHRNSCWFIQKELQTRPFIYTTSSRRFRKLIG